MTYRSDLDDAERLTVQAALGRMFRLMSRPAQDGDVEQYERCRAAVLDVLDPTAPAPFGELTRSAPSPCYARDRRRGAAGD